MNNQTCGKETMNLFSSPTRLHAVLGMFGACVMGIAQVRENYLRLISAYLEENRKEAGMNMRRTGSFCYFISIRFFGELCHVNYIRVF